MICDRLKPSRSEYSGLLTTFYKNRKSGVALDYALSFVALARLCKMDALILHGNASEWNRIKVNGKWYNADTYFDDPDTPINIDHFLKSDKNINKDGMHVLDEQYKKFAPKAGKDYKAK